MTKFIRVVKLDGSEADINVSSIEMISYDDTNDKTTFTLKMNKTITVHGNWRKLLVKFLQSGAVWTNGQRNEYAS